jgi:hypothetical protein
MVLKIITIICVSQYPPPIFLILINSMQIFKPKKRDRQSKLAVSFD